MVALGLNSGRMFAVVNMENFRKRQKISLKDATWKLAPLLVGMRRR